MSGFFSNYVKTILARKSKTRCLTQIVNDLQIALHRLLLVLFDYEFFSIIMKHTPFSSTIVRKSEIFQSLDFSCSHCMYIFCMNSFMYSILCCIVFHFYCLYTNKISSFKSVEICHFVFVYPLTLEGTYMQRII